MNDLLLSGQLRALRAPPPDNAFEARLQHALAKAARMLRAPRAVVPFRSARRLQSWAARVGLGTVLALGASAAAAAAGYIWAFGVIRTEPVTSSPVAPGLEQGAGHRARSTAPVVVSPGPAAPESAPPAPLEPVASAVSEVSPPVERKAMRSGAPARAKPVPAVEAPREGPEALVPFELPKSTGPVSVSRGASASRANAPGSERGTPASAIERRALPQLPARAEHQPGRPQRAEREKQDKDRKEPPRRDIARQRSLDNAERGLERAREARERNEK